MNKTLNPIDLNLVNPVILSNFELGNTDDALLYDYGIG